MKPDDDRHARDHIRAVQPLAVGVQYVGTLLWVVAWLLADPSYAYDGVVLALTGLLMLATATAGLFVPLSWTAGCSTLAVWLIAGGFGLLIEPAADRLFWAMALTVAITLVIATMFYHVTTYVLAAVGAWLILGQGNVLMTPSGSDRAWALLLQAAVLGLGLMLNFAFHRIRLQSIRFRHDLEDLAFRDALTGIDNRRSLLARLQERDRVAQHASDFFLMIDVDDFKRINDEFGHAMGDRVLQQIAAVLRDTTGPRAYGRLGGEEFGVLVVDADRAAAQALALDILARVRHLRAGERAVSVSIGLAAWPPGGTSADLMREADQALYEAKRLGKDRVVAR